MNDINNIIDTIIFDGLTVQNMTQNFTSYDVDKKYRFINNKFYDITNMITLENIKTDKTILKYITKLTDEQTIMIIDYDYKLICEFNLHKYINEDVLLNITNTTDIKFTLYESDKSSAIIVDRILLHNLIRHNKYNLKNIYSLNGYINKYYIDIYVDYFNEYPNNDYDYDSITEIIYGYSRNLLIEMLGKINNDDITKNLLNRIIIRRKDYHQIPFIDEVLQCNKLKLLICIDTLKSCGYDISKVYDINDVENIINIPKEQQTYEYVKKVLDNDKKLVKYCDKKYIDQYIKTKIDTIKKELEIISEIQNLLEQ